MYYTHPGCWTSIFGENRAYCIRDFTVTEVDAGANYCHAEHWATNH